VRRYESAKQRLRAQLLLKAAPLQHSRCSQQSCSDVLELLAVGQHQRETGLCSRLATDTCAYMPHTHYALSKMDLVA
jgi:hypothetical protein